jgi:hypothetical protein
MGKDGKLSFLIPENGIADCSFNGAADRFPIGSLDGKSPDGSSL